MFCYFVVRSTQRRHLKESDRTIADDGVKKKVSKEKNYDMAGGSKKVWHILLFCASIVGSEDTVTSTQSKESVPEKQDGINTNAITLCEY